VVECDLAKVEVAGSNPVSRSNIETSRPLAAPARALHYAAASSAAPLRAWLMNVGANTCSSAQRSTFRSSLSTVSIDAAGHSK
jgi:hypothetical protein